jgi:hypothetical protein
MTVGESKNPPPPHQGGFLFSVPRGSSNEVDHQEHDQGGKRGRKGRQHYAPDHARLFG